MSREMSANSKACLNRVCVNSILNIRHATPTVSLFHRNSFEYFAFTLPQPPCMYGKLNCVNATHIGYETPNVCAPIVHQHIKTDQERDDVILLVTY